MIRIVGFLALLAVIAGCSDVHTETLAPDFGSSVRSNVAAQVVNPQPLLDSRPAEENGQRAFGAIDRYRRDRTTPLLPPYASDIPAPAAPAAAADTASDSH